MIKRICKGVVIGIANIVPGVSGGTMMVAMGIYDQLIHCVTHLLKEFKKSVLFLLPILIGMGIAVVGGSVGLEYLFDHFPIQTTLLFIGLILGGFPAIWQKVKGNTIQAGHIVSCVLFFAMVVGLALLGEREGASANLAFSLVNCIKLFVVGVIAAGTMVIPGVSGSMILLLLGYYNEILSAVSDFVHALVSLDMTGIGQGIGVLAPFGVGVLIGVVAIAKLVEWIFEKFPQYAYWAIIGLIVASPFAILLMGSFPAVTVLSVITGLAALAVGFFIALKLGE